MANRLSIPALLAALLFFSPSCDDGGGSVPDMVDGVDDVANDAPVDLGDEADSASDARADLGDDTRDEDAGDLVTDAADQGDDTDVLDVSGDADAADLEGDAVTDAPVDGDLDAIDAIDGVAHDADASAPDAEVDADAQVDADAESDPDSSPVDLEAGPDAASDADLDPSDADTGRDLGLADADLGGPDADVTPDADATADAGDVGAPDADASPPISGLDRRPSNPTCVAADRLLPAHGVEFTRVFPALSFTSPVLMIQEPGVNDRWYVVEQWGRVSVFDNTSSADTATTFIDISDRVYTGFNEQGLLGMAFAPDFASSGEFYLSYIDRVAGQYRSRISRFSLDDRGLGDRTTEQAILTVAQPDWNHNGGNIAFGPDGYLYIGLGDGGNSRDLYGNGQNIDTLLAAMLRIDVSGGGTGYTVPVDNPFVGRAGADEIWAWGLRNPWRWSFDSETGDLWAGDVGQNHWEEIDIIVREGNYGWPYREGTHCPPWQSAANCATPGLIEPVTDYGRSEGYSVTGGYVYRGSAMPALYGDYIFGDFGTRSVWAYGTDPTSGEPFVEDLGVSPSFISSFAQDQDGELYVVGYDGALWALEPPSVLPTEDFPTLLSETGCVDPEDPTVFAPGVVPYDINVPFWSDGAIKTRYVALPNATFISVEDDGDFTLPIGSVVIKQFELDGRLIETRLLMRHADGDWAGYSYVWNDEQSDAELALDGAVVTVGERQWEVPSSAECLACHTPAAGSTLGLETGQLNRDLTYPSTGRTANQIATWHEIVYFSGGAMGDDPDTYERYPDATSDDTHARARAYLHSNCSHCHRPGAGRTNMDLRYGTSFADTETCDVSPTLGDLGVSGARLIAPGSAARSIIWQRMSRREDEAQMPPLGSTIVDTEGSVFIGAWIDGLSDCP